MAYIEKEPIIEFIKKGLNNQNKAEAFGYDAIKILAEIEYAPTADVVEVKHGKWVNASGFDVCNICGTSPAYWEPKPNNPKGYPPYCHNCGAKMDGESNSVI